MKKILLKEKKKVAPKGSELRSTKVEPGKKVKKIKLEKKEKVKKVVKVEELKEEKVELEEKDNKNRYFEAVGRRKTSVSVVRIFTQGEKGFLINKRPYQEYFPTLELQQIILSPLEKMNCIDRFRITVNSRGGGIHSQAEALRHGLSRVLILFNSTFRKRLKKAGYLTRDSRMRERKKFGLKRARRAPQWSKR